MKKYFRQIPLSLVFTSTAAALITKDFLTPLILMGKEFGDRSPIVQILILMCFSFVYLLFFWKLFPKFVIQVATTRLNQRAFFLILFLVTVGIMSSKLFVPGMISGYDIDYHMLRIESLSESIRLGQIPARVNPLFLNGYGYASSLFYPDLFLYLPALLRVLGFNTILSAKIFFAIIFGLCFLSAYWAGREITKSHNAGILTAVVYCLSQYLLQNVYRRGAVGEMQAFIFLPLIIYGLYSLVFERFEKYWVMAIGLIGLLYSHLISTLIAAFLVAVVGLFHVRTIIFDKARIMRSLKMIAITLCSTISIWLPLIEQLNSGSFRFSESTYLARYSAVPISVVFAVTGKFSGNYVAFGLPTLLLCLTWFAARKVEKDERLKQISAWGLGIGAVLLLLVTNAFPWEWINGPVNIIQFPWRLYGPAGAFLAIAIGSMLKMAIPVERQRVGAIMLIAFLGIHATWVINVSGSQPRDLPTDFYRQAENTFLVNNAEWLPAQTDLEMLQNSKAKVVDEKGQNIAFTRRGQEMRIEPIPQCEYLDFPLIYYVGYEAHYRDSAGNRYDLPISPVLPNYTIRIHCPQAASTGSIQVAYNGTFLQKASLLGNLFFVCGLAALYQYKRDVYS